MGEAKRRGTFGERKAQAVAARQLKPKPRRTATDGRVLAAIASALTISPGAIVIEPEGFGRCHCGEITSLVDERRRWICQNCDERCPNGCGPEFFTDEAENKCCVECGAVQEELNERIPNDEPLP